MKYVKSLLALATAALLGSSAQAVNNVSLKVGEIYPSEGWINYTYKSTQGNERWYMINSERGAGDTCDIVKGIFENPHPQRRYLTNGVQNPNFKYEAVSAGEVTLHLWRTSASGDKIPQDAQYPYEGDTGNQWMDTTSNPTDQSYHFTVTDTPQTDGLTAGPVEAGTRLSAIATSTIRGEVVDTNGNPVEGSLAWKSGTTQVAEGENTCKATFTPSGDKAKYFDTVDLDVTIIGQAPKTPATGAAQTLKVGESATLTDVTWTKSWEAYSLNPDLVSITATGAAGDKPEIEALAAGAAKVTVEDDTTRYTYAVTIWEEKQDNVSVSINRTKSDFTCEAVAAGAWTGSSDNDAVATVTVSGSGATVNPQIRGVSEGSTTVTIQNPYVQYRIAVTVNTKTPAEQFAEILDGQTGNASVDATTDPNALILLYEAVGTSSLTIPDGYGAKADILAVGGGGGGGGCRYRNSSYRSGSGGNAGGMDEQFGVDLTPQTLSVTVGKGGAGGGYSTSNSAPSGSNGTASTVVNGTKTYASGSAGTGGSCGTSPLDGDGAARTSAITGGTVTYATGGKKQASTLTGTTGGAATTNGTGNGGDGAPATQNCVGAGGDSGIVVIKITALNELKDVTVETPPEEVTAKSGTTLGTISLTGGKAVDANGTKVEGTFKFVDSTYALKVTDDGNLFDVIFNPADGATYKTATCKVAVSVTATAKSAITAVGASTPVGGTDDQPIYSFTTTTGNKSITIPAGYKATVQLLVVGGGGGGGYATYASSGSGRQRYGNGGDGGQVLGGNNSTITRTVGAGETLNITVGAGGTAGTAGQKGNTDAQPGGDSSVTGGSSFGAEVKANGGSAGGNTQKSSNAQNGTGAGATQTGTTTGVQSNLRTGTNTTYGEGGVKGSSTNPAPADGGSNTGKGGGGAAATSSGTKSGYAGGSGIVVIKVTSFEALPKDPVVESLSVTPVKRGDALSTSAITLTMGDPKTHANVPGDYDWKAPATVVSAPGEYPIVFTPTKAGYAEVEVMAQVSVIAPQEDDAEEVIDNGTSVAVTTTSFGGDWSATVVSGASYIETPELTVNDDDTATVTIKGKAIGTAVIDLYDGATWVKRITVAVMAPPIERTVELTMDIDDAAKTVQTTTTATYWGNTIVSGADFVTATTTKDVTSGTRTATTTITPKAYGTAVIEVRSGSSQDQLNTLVQRIIVTVAPPTDGTQTITVAQNASKVVKTASVIDNHKVTEGTASISSVTVGDREATIVASGTIGTAKVKLYNGDTLVKVVTVNVVDPTHTILTLCYAEVMEFTLTNATSVSWTASASGNVRLMTAATTAATSQNGSGASFTIKICGYTANGSGTVTVMQGQNTVMTYDCTVLADIAEDTTDGYNSIQPGKKPLSVYIGEPLNLSYYRQSATKWRFVDAEITSDMFGKNPDPRSKYTYKELGVFKATTSKGYTYSKGESGTASTSANLTSATSSDFDVKLEGVKTGTGPLAICFGANQPSHYAGYYDVTVYQPIAKPAATLSFTYNGEAKAPVASGEGYTVSGDATKMAAGTYTAIVMLDEYYCWPDHSTDPIMVEWTIDPAEITSATAANQTYTGSALTPELTVQAGGLDATYDLGAWNPAVLTDAGTYTATVTGKGNFKGEKTVTFTIDPKPITVTACDTNMLVGCTAPQFKYEVTSGALVGTDELVGTLCTTDTLTVGTHDIVRANDWNNPNYDITFVKGTLTVRAGKVTVNGKGYDDVAAAMDVVTSNGGTAVFNGDETFKVFTFEKDTTLTVADGAWFVTNNLTLAATTVTNDISVSEKLTLAGNVTVGSDDYEATLAFGSIELGGHQLTLTTNGVVQSSTALDTDAVFAEVEHFHVAGNPIVGGFEYTLEATEFYVKYYDGDEVVHSNKFTILNYMTDLRIWDGDRSDENLELVKYEKEKGGELEQTDDALRAYVKDEADDPGCDGEVKVLGTWKKTTATIEIVAEAGITDVQTNGESVVGTLTLPVETTEIELELVKGGLTIPVYKVITNDVTNVTQRVATYAVVDGLTYTFIAEEAEEDDPDVTPVQKKQAIIDAIDKENKAVVGPKIEAVVDTSETPAEGKVTPDEMATWITEKEIKSVDMKESDFLVASVKLDADKALTEADEVTVNSASGNVETAGIAITVQVDESDVTANLPNNVKVQVKGTNDEGQVEMELVQNGDVVSMKPKNPAVMAYAATLEVLSDDGTKVLSSQKVGFLKKAPIRAETDLVKGAREFLSVPWASLAGDGDIALANFLVTDNLAEGTKLYSYDSANKRYNAWKLNAQKIWDPIKTVKVVRGKVITQDADTAESAKIARGKAVWLEREDATEPVVFVGQAGGEESVEPSTAEGWNAVSAPGYSDVDVSEMFPASIAAEGDQIIVPGADEPEVIFTFKSSAWNYRFQKMVKIFGKDGMKVFEGTVGDGKAEGRDKIKAGTGFWYVKKAVEQ